MASSSSAEALGDDANDTEIFCGLSPHDYLAVKFFMISIVGTLIGLFGLFGNFTTIIVLTRPSMRNPNNLFLTALAVFDSCLLVTAFFIYAMEYIIEYTEAFDLYVAWLTYLRFAYALSHISQTGSVYITVSVTIERYMAVCYPRRAKRMCSSRGSALAILSVSSFAVIFNATKFFELEVTRNPPCGDGVNWQSYILRPSNLALNPLYGEIYSLWLTNSVMVFFPFICLLTLNSIIAYTIRKSLRRMKFSDKYQSVLQTLSIERRLQALKRHENRMDGRSELKNKSREASLVLVIIVAIFLICNFWGFVLTLVEQIVDRAVLDENYHAFYTFSREAINFLAIINSSINFVIYIIFGKDFRRELVVVYGCGLRPLSLRLPVHDKFSIWRHISRSLSRRPTTRRDKNSQTTSDLAGSDQPLIATQLPRVPFNDRPDAFSSMSPPTSPAAEDEESPPPDPSTARLLPTLQVVVAKGGLAQSQLVFEDL